MPKRIKKQLIIGAIYLSLFALGLTLLFFPLVRKIKNSGLEFKKPEIISLNFFKNTPQWGSVLIKVKNSNPNFALENFSYQVLFFDKDHHLLKQVTAKDFIYPLEVKYLTLAKVNLETQKVAQLKVVLKGFKIKKTLKKNSFLEAREIKFKFSQPPEAGYAFVEGILKNNNSVLVRKAKIIVIFKNSLHQEIGFGETYLFDLKPHQERYFRILFEKEALKSFEDKINLQDLEVYAYGAVF